MKVKYFIPLMLVAVMMLATLAACGGSAPTGGGGAAGSTTSQIESDPGSFTFTVTGAHEITVTSDEGTVSNLLNTYDDGREPMRSVIMRKSREAGYPEGEIMIIIDGELAEGTYPLTEVFTHSIQYVYTPAEDISFQNFTRVQSGLLTITRVEGTRITGSFDFVISGFLFPADDDEDGETIDQTVQISGTFENLAMEGAG